MRERVERRERPRSPRTPEAESSERAIEAILARLAGGFAGEHGTLRQVVESVEALAKARSFVTASKSWGGFRILQERHIASEELILSILEDEFGPCASIGEARAAHARLKALLQTVGQALTDWDLPRFRREFGAFRRELERHWAHEVDVLLADCRLGLADPGARERVAARLTRI